MPRKGGLYKRTGGGKPELVKTTSPVKRDRAGRVVNPDQASVVKGRPSVVRPDDSRADKPKAQASAVTDSVAVGAKPAEKSTKSK